MHTMNLLWIRSLLAFCTYNPIVFLMDYRTELRLTRLEFAYILVAGEVGAILATFGTDLNRKYISKRNQQIIFVWVLIGGISRTLFPLFTYLDDEKREKYRLGMIIWCCLMRATFGVSYAFSDTACKAFATDYVDSNRITEILTILNYSLPLCFLYNVAAGYVIDTESCMFVFLWSGLILIASSVLSEIIFDYFPLVPLVEGDIVDLDEANFTEHSEDEEDHPEMDHLKIVASGSRHSSSAPAATPPHYEVLEADEFRRKLVDIFTNLKAILILYASFFSTLRLRSMMMVFGSLWMETVYGLSAHELGLTTLCSVAGEVFALETLRRVSQRVELWMVATATLVHQLIFGAGLFILSSVYGNNIGLGGALVFIALLWFGEILFRVVQQANAVHYAPRPDLKFQMLLAQNMSGEFAAIVAVLATETVFDESGQYGIMVFCVIWMACTANEAFVLYIYSDPDGKPELNSASPSPRPAAGHVLFDRNSTDMTTAVITSTL